MPLRKISIGVQINGKRRGEIAILPDCPQELAVEEALSVDEIAKYLGGAEIDRIVYVP